MIQGLGTGDILLNVLVLLQGNYQTMLACGCLAEIQEMIVVNVGLHHQCLSMLIKYSPNSLHAVERVGKHKQKVFISAMKVEWVIWGK